MEAYAAVSYWRVVQGNNVQVSFVYGKVRIAPKALIGTASITENGTDQLSYKAARKRKTKVIEKRKMNTVLEPALISS